MDCLIVNNYRPISVLPIFSRIFEKCLFNRLLKFVDQCNILTESQYGFRPGYSTSSAIVDLIYKVTNALDKKKILIGLFLDLSKAFDTLDHSILFHKLENYGIRGILLDLLRNYLTNRKQFVVVNGNESYLSDVGCGVPQGSILGPLLFLIYMNDICASSQKLEFILYADDTSVFLSDNNIDNLILNFNDELLKLNSWLISNKLIVNTKKNSLYDLF